MTVYTRTPEEPILPPLANSNVLRDIVAGYFADRATLTATFARLDPHYDSHRAKMKAMAEAIEQIDHQLDGVIAAASIAHPPTEGAST